MKKAKIMLSAIAVVAVVSGAMAFNAHKTGQILFSCDAPGDHPNGSTFGINDFTTTGGSQITYTTTSDQDATCTTALADVE